LSEPVLRSALASEIRADMPPDARASGGTITT
jgi:hypothetical protein